MGFVEKRLIISGDIGSGQVTPAKTANLGVHWVKSATIYAIAI
jgi:hypothetical protein